MSLRIVGTLCGLGMFAIAAAVMFHAMSSRYTLEALPRGLVRMDGLTGQISKCETVKAPPDATGIPFPFASIECGRYY